MLSRNNSYFDPQLCVDGHYIVTGRTNDQFCADDLTLTDVVPALHGYLRYEQGFDAVFFLDTENMLFCLDGASFAVLTGEAPTAPEAPTASEAPVSAGGPLGRRRRRRAEAAAEAPRADARRPLNLGRMSLDAAWQQVSGVMRHSGARCALIIANANLMQGGESLLLELSSFYSTNHSVVIYLFRETSLENVGEWTAFARNVLLPRIRAREPESNRVISLPTPNAREIENLLNRLRLDGESGLAVEPGDVRALGGILASSCARNNWGLAQLLNRLLAQGAARPGTALTRENWRAFTEEETYRPALEELEDLVGQEEVKSRLRAWRDDALRRGAQRREPLSSSRFAPLPAQERRLGMSLNVQLLGAAGTGKSTIARLIGRMYYDLGLLSRGRVVEVSAADLVSVNVSGSAGQVRRYVQEALGGVLFIDEAYALAEGGHGQEAINELVFAMSAYEGQFAVILAGYPRQMREFLRANEGLSGRFPNEYVLQDYAPAQMQEIFLRMARAEGVAIGEALQARLADFFETFVGGRGQGWSNARECATLLQEMKRNCSRREAAAALCGETYTLQPEDVPERLRRCLEPRSRGPAEAMARIDRMIGLGGIKLFLRRLVQGALVGAGPSAPGNFLFLGPPGTGKTTVARRMGELMHLLHILRRDHVTELRAADLISGAVDLNRAVEDARGGVFFLDEAHQLAESERGRSLIRALVPLVEDPQIHAETCFICAGYAVEMRAFLAADPGLERRFPPRNRIRFYDYTAAELTQILAEMARASGQEPEEGYLLRSRAALSRYLLRRPQNFGNGGFIRETYLPASIEARTRRLSRRLTGSADGLAAPEQLRSLREEERRSLTAEDLPEDFARLAGPLGAPLPERSAMQRLEGLLGKEEIVDFARARAQGRSEEAQFLDEAEETGLHYAIGGPTGSGRHTAVRALAAVFREAGLLERDEVLFVGVGDLEAGYVGQTRLRTQDAIERAAGGTLCVEYPSSLLAEKGERSYGPEALDALCAGLAAHSGDTCFVFLDSAEGMEAVFRAAPALRGAMSRIFTLEDLSHAQMEAIFREKTRDGMTFAPEVEALLPDFFLNWVGSRGGTGEGGGWAGGLALDRLIEDLRAAWQRGGGETVEEERGEEGARYRLRLRRIERAHFPGALQRYLTPSRAVAKDALQALEALPGLAGVKRSLRAIRRRVRYAGGARPGCYLYLGNPGVGKTTVARLMGGLLCAAGALAQGHVVERTARALCDDLDEFDQLVKLSRGGILFIDEAHQLAEPGTYRGREAIKRLLTVLEDAAVTSSTAIILAGYPAPMLRLLEQDEGLRSRFGSRESMVLFADYSAAELVQVMDYMASRAKDVPEIGARQALTLTEGFRARSLAVFQAVLARGDRNFGNARFVRTYLHDALSAQLERLERDYGELDDPPLDEIDVLTEADVPAPWRESAVRRRAAVDVSRLRTQRGEAVEEAGYDAACAALSPSVVLLEVYRGGQRSGTATGVLVSEDGLVLTCAHVVRAAERIRARVSCPGAPGGDTRWLEGEILEPVCGDCDLALLQLPGENYAPAPLRPAGEAVRPHERTLLLGYPLGDTLSAGNAEDLRLSDFAGRVASVQRVGAVERCYIDSTGLHGNSGSPVFSREDRRVIGIFSGSLVPGGERSLDELNYFYPLSYFWERFIQASD